VSLSALIPYPLLPFQSPLLTRCAHSSGGYGVVEGFSKWLSGTAEDFIIEKVSGFI
jgi:hypothetical protein